MLERPLHEGKLDRAQALSNAQREEIYATISATPVSGGLSSTLDS